jgi:hypothetical protein
MAVITWHYHNAFHNFHHCGFNIQRRVLGMSHVKVWKFSILAYTVVVIYRVNVYWEFQEALYRAGLSYDKAFSILLYSTVSLPLYIRSLFCCSFMFPHLVVALCPWSLIIHIHFSCSQKNHFMLIPLCPWFLQSYSVPTFRFYVIPSFTCLYVF